MSVNLSTDYGGLKIRNPIIIGASNIVTDVNNLIKLEEAGAAAVVYKSLFEEQIQLESLQLDQLHESYSDLDAEHNSIFPAGHHAGPAEYLRQLRVAKKSVSIPIIGSLNCIHDHTWLEYSLRMADTGIDALELNFYNSNMDFDTKSDVIEERQIKTLQLVRENTALPLFVKLSPFYSNTLQFISKLDKIGVDGFVLFNRLFQPDIDVENEVHHFPYNFSSESDNRLALRYAGLLYKKISGSVVCNTGILTGKDVVKMILAGGDAVQMVSAIYKKGVHIIATVLNELETWMKRKGYTSLQDFQGKLSEENMTDPFAYKRAQYVDILMKAEIFMKYHPRQGRHEVDNGHGEFDNI